MKKSLPEPPLESPVPFRPGSNGEFIPAPETAKDRRAEALFRDLVDERSRRLGVDRRSFLAGACGTTTALFVINAVYGCGDDGETTVPPYDVDAGSTWDADAACAKIGGDEFIFDVQTHHVNPAGIWRESSPGMEAFLASLPQGDCGESDPVVCFDVDHYLREVFVRSDTAVAVLTALPATPGTSPLEVEEMAATRALVDRLAGSPRSLIHGIVLPERGAPELEAMARLVEDHAIAAWKVYTPYGEFRLDDEAIGIPFLERARSLGVPIVAAHKGLRLFGFDPEFASPDDIGPAASLFPDLSFVVYHSGFETDLEEGPYTPESPSGVDRLISTVLDHGIGPRGNVYAELGSTWRLLMTRPTEAAHVLGKLLLHLGEDRIVWGTDSIWYGSPQDQIAAFRTFQIPVELQEAHGYPALTAQAKAKIFGLNSAALYGVDPAAVRCAISEDDITSAKEARHLLPPSFKRVGPQSRRELFAMLRAHGGRPG